MTDFPLATLDQDEWLLDSGEEAHRENPDTFWIPVREDRENLKPGHLVKLTFQILETDEDGAQDVFGQRMWVLVTGGNRHGYLGILCNEPGNANALGDHYLTWGAEVPFLPEHVIDIGEAQQDFIAEVSAKTPTRRWRGRLS